VGLGVVVVLGGATMLTQNTRFMMAKPSIVHFAAAAAMLDDSLDLDYADRPAECFGDDDGGRRVCLGGADGGAWHHQFGCRANTLFRTIVRRRFAQSAT